MLRMRFLPCTSVLILCAAFAASAQTTAFTGKAKAVAEADQAWAAAFDAKDDARVMSFLDPGAAVFISNQPPATTPSEIADVFKPILSQDVTFHWHLLHVELSSTGDMAFTDGSYEVSYVGSSGNTVNDKGKYITIWRLQKDGSWKVLRDIGNTNLPTEY